MSDKQTQPEKEFYRFPVRYWQTGLLILLLLSAVFLGFRVLHLNSKVNEIQSKYPRLQERVDSLNIRMRLPVNGESFSGLLSRYDLSQLRQKGLANPVEDLKTDLLGKPELIPDEGILGGTMQFYPEHIYILSSQWVMAYYDDGHIAGQMLLKYSVEPGGKITWKVLDSSLE